MNSKLLVKYIRNYFLILSASLLVLIAFYVTIYKETKERVLSEANYNLEQSVNNFDTMISKMDMLASVLGNNEYVRAVSDIEGQAAASDAYKMIKATEYMFNCYQLRMESFEEWLMFKNNDVIITDEFSLSNTKIQTYEQFEWGGMDFQEFRSTVFENPKGTLYVSQEKDNKSSGIIGIIKTLEKGKQQRRIGLVFKMSDELIDEGLGIHKDKQTNFAYITDKQGEMLYQVNYSGEPIAQDVLESGSTRLNGQRYTLFRAYTTNKSLCYILGISDKTIQQEIDGINSLVRIYMVLAVFGLLIVCILCARSSARGIRSMVNKIEKLENAVSDSVLEKILLLGVYSSSEKEEIQSYLGWGIDYYCIACISVRTTNNEREILECFASVDEFFDKHFQYWAVNSSRSERNYIIRIEERDAPNIDSKVEIIQLLLNEELPIRVGISAVGSGLENIQHCYQQAKLMNRQIALTNKTCIKTYQGQLNAKDSIYNLNLNNRIYELIYAREKEELKGLFQKIRAYVEKNGMYSEDRLLQLFFEIKNPIIRVWDEIGREDDKSHLSYQPDKTVAELIDLLEYTALDLCDYLSAKKEKSNKSFLYDVIQFIEENYMCKEMCISYAAQYAGLSDKYFATLFKAETGKTFGAYVEELRMKQAERYLKETEMSMSRIADVVGYNTLDAFYKSFKRIHQMAPGKWREIGK